MSGIREDGHVNWDGPPCREDLGVTFAEVPDPPVWSVPLSFGGDLSICEDADGNYRLSLDVNGGHFSYPCTALDVWEVRQLTGRIVHSRACETLGDLTGGE